MILPAISISPRCPVAGIGNPQLEFDSNHHASAILPVVLNALFAIPRTCQHHATQAGFTLVELIAVIIILASLAASALPRFINLVEEAHQSDVAMTAATFSSAVFMASAACQVRNYAGLDNLPIFGAGNVDFNANCLPSSTNGNNNLTVNAARCLQVWNGILSPAPSISTTAVDTTDYRAQGGGSTCTYTYRDDDDTLRRFSYNAATGRIAVVNP